MIDKITRENTVNDVKDGMSYSQAAKKYGVEDTAVRRWCRDVGVRSFHASRRKTNDEILDAVKLHKAITCCTLSEILGCSNSALNKHLRTMVVSGKIQSFRVPALSSGARIRCGLFTKYVNTRIYFVSNDDLAVWIRSQLPEEVSSSLRGYVTHIFQSIGIQIFKDVKK